MPDLSITSVASLSTNVVQVVFNVEPNSTVYTRSNYGFTVRFGDKVPIYVKTVQQVNVTTYDLVLYDAMLVGGNYALNITTLTSNTTPVAIAEIKSFTAAHGYSKFYFDIKKSLPSWWKTNYGSNLSGIISAISVELSKVGGDTSSDAILSIRQGLMIRLATGGDLTTIAANYGVNRPDFLKSDDTRFRELIPHLVGRPKTTLKNLYDILDAVISPRVNDHWKLWEISPNLITLEYSESQFATANLGGGLTTPASASYPMGSSSGSPDYMVLDSTVSGSTVGNNIVILHGPTGAKPLLDLVRAAGVKTELEAY